MVTTGSVTSRGFDAINIQINGSESEELKFECYKSYAGPALSFPPLNTTDQKVEEIQRSALPVDKGLESNDITWKEMGLLLGGYLAIGLIVFTIFSKAMYELAEKTEKWDISRYG